MASGRHWLPTAPASRQQLQQQQQKSQPQQEPAPSLIESSIPNHHSAYAKEHLNQQKQQQQQHHYQQYSVVSAPIYHHSHHSIQPVPDHNFNLLENLAPSNNKHQQALAAATAKVSLINRDDGIQQRNAARLM